MTLGEILFTAVPDTVRLDASDRWTVLVELPGGRFVGVDGAYRDEDGNLVLIMAGD